MRLDLHQNDLRAGSTRPPRTTPRIRTLLAGFCCWLSIAASAIASPEAERIATLPELHAVDSAAPVDWLLSRDAGDWVWVAIDGASLHKVQLIVRPDRLGMNLILYATDSFSSIGSSVPDIDHPFDFAVLNLRISTEGGEQLSGPLIDGVRSCLQMAQLVQLQPDRLSLQLRFIEGASTVLDLTATEWLYAGFLQGDAGDIRCTLKTL